MKPEALNFLRCPACHSPLQIAAGAEGPELDEGELKCGGCGRQWPVHDGLPHLVFPEELKRQDADSLNLWNRIALAYDWIAVATSTMRGVPDTRERRDLIARLELGPGDTVLETATGTARTLRFIPDEMGEDVTAFGLDISPRMLKRAARKLRNTRARPHLALGNVHSLPLADGAFDAVLDGFGMKYYSDKPRAIREMLRVVKPGGKVVIAELGLPPGKARSFRQRLLLLWIPGFAGGPPLDAIPADVRDLKLEWDAHETAYTIDFRKVGAPAERVDPHRDV